MNNIIADIEDFTEKQNIKEQHNLKLNLYENEYKKTKVREIFNSLYLYCKENENKLSESNFNIKKFTTSFIDLYHKKCRISKIPIKKTDIILDYYNQINENDIKKCYLFEKMICKKPSRSISGINSITLVMSPYPNGQTFSCKHNCYYCPNEPAHKGNNNQAQPRSYLYHEPAVRRANQHNFKAYEQMKDRLDTLRTNGHPCDKIEIILEGGTYTEYPIDYLEEYNRDIYYTANTYFDTEKRQPFNLDEEVKLNRNSKVHIIGNCIETRPDAIDDFWIMHFRRCGVTRIQLGVQTTHNHILKKINRGHNIECALNCIEKLKNLCFKIDIHLMPDLPYSTPELDKEMFDYTYKYLQPDQIKIYPCAVVPWTIIEKWYNNEIWKPYEPDVLRDVMDYALHNCPEWIRLPRVIRDIPGIYIQAGNKTTNLRQQLTESKEIRSREIERHEEYYNKPAKIFIDNYNTIKKPNGSIINDYFISYESLDKIALFGFIRLRIENENKNELFPCLNNSGLIRELHVYGFNTKVGESAKASQHRGIGSKLLQTAEDITKQHNLNSIVVISGEGVKEYYKKKGYYEIDTYMKKELEYNNQFDNKLNLCNIMFIIIDIVVFYLIFRLIII